jgi:hypothetical protein
MLLEHAEKIRIEHASGRDAACNEKAELIIEYYGSALF